MLTKNEYLARAQADDHWAPGWLAVETAFTALYPGVRPAHLAAQPESRAALGGEEFIDGCSIYPSHRGYQHLVTFGMSNLYVDEASFGGDLSGWGYEMTAKVYGQAPEDAFWAVTALSGLARYTNESGRWFEPFQYVNGRGRPLGPDADCALTSFLVVPDTEVAGLDTEHGRVDFLQFVGITQQEADWLAAGGPDQARGPELARRLGEATGPYLATDLNRTRSVV